MIQEQVLNYILNTKDSSLIILNRLDDSFFPNYKNEWNYIVNHFNTYGVIPDKESFLNSFPDFDLINVNELLQYLVDEYSELRQKADYKTLPVTARLLETLIRLSTAHVKMRLSPQVEKKDCEYV